MKGDVSRYARRIRNYGIPQNTVKEAVIEKGKDKEHWKSRAWGKQWMIITLACPL
ncbi:MAG: hypothetical protein M2R45_02937 [Verrucomicrobia subdivision 3 bacterium]|nr:hypothetical protein [Limisphaerales bacterium]MCS1415342.1 hypothetical protein [Limisphaerales bacterium]